MDIAALIAENARRTAEVQAKYAQAEESDDGDLLINNNTADQLLYEAEQAADALKEWQVGKLEELLGLLGKPVIFTLTEEQRQQLWDDVRDAHTFRIAFDGGDLKWKRNEGSWTAGVDSDYPNKEYAQAVCDAYNANQRLGRLTLTAHGAEQLAEKTGESVDKVKAEARRQGFQIEE